MRRTIISHQFMSARKLLQRDSSTLCCASLIALSRNQLRCKIVFGNLEARLLSFTDPRVELNACPRLLEVMEEKWHSPAGKALGPNALAMRRSSAHAPHACFRKPQHTDTCRPDFVFPAPPNRTTIAPSSRLLHTRDRAIFTTAPCLLSCHHHDRAIPTQAQRVGLSVQPEDSHGLSSQNVRGHHKTSKAGGATPQGLGQGSMYLHPRCNARREILHVCSARLARPRPSYRSSR
jgi:hypothetical protein